MRIALKLLACSLIFAGTPVLGQQTFDSVILDDGSFSPYLRFDPSGSNAKFIVGFGDFFGFYDGDNYSMKVFNSAPGDALVLDDDGLTMQSRLFIEDEGAAYINLDLTDTGQRARVIALSSNNGLYDGGIGFSNAIANFPLYVFNTALSETLSLGEFGVGVGTYSSTAPVHVYADGTPFDEASIVIENDLPDVAPRTLFELRNPGNTKFELINTDANESWAFANSGVDFRISRQGSGEVEFRVDNLGDLHLAGILFENSDRNAKTNIVPVDPESILEKVAELPIAQWAYTESPGSYHIGPMAQDFRAAFGTGDLDTKLASLDVGGVAMASIQALVQRDEARANESRRLAAENRDLKAQNRELAQRLEQLEQRAERFEAMLFTLAPGSETRVAVKY